MGDPASTIIPPAKGDCPAVRFESLKKTQKVVRADDVVSTIIGDSLIAFRKKFYFPNDMVIKVPTKFDRTCSPPPGFVISHVDCNGTDRAFQRSCNGVVSIGRVSFRSKWLDICTRDPSKESSKKWGKLKELPVPLHFRAKDLLKILKLRDIDTLHYKMKLLVQSGIVYSSRKIACANVKKVCKKFGSSSPAFKKDILKHQCVGRRRAEELLEQHTDFKLEMTKTLNDCNNEFVKVKYLQGEYNKKYDRKVKVMKVMEDQLAEC
ncbi:hypothetical protein IEQ34_009783 [Dendrobium chrysotoxum]|uniref:Uncharacterized protein n=1 Tax=Dendrobium chrysotoxum TaxID=161865 RepID=A0AAV7H2I3_DENCH|nr:hypothetical protein IEQ34_009783 [Dendrobium chrysotoxum]